jgi:flagellar motor component MotA
MRERFQNILSMKTKRRALFSSLLLILCIIVTGGLVACGTQNSTSDASDVVTKYLEAQKSNDNHTLNSLLWKAANDQRSDAVSETEGTLGVISLSIDKVEVSKEETQSIKERYTGSDLALINEWSDEFIKENLIAVYAKYTVDYDNTKVPYNEGEITQYFYLLRSDKDSPWLIWEQSYDVVD